MICPVLSMIFELSLCMAITTSSINQAFIPQKVDVQLS
jgi:hypothetical protein